jgi:hypothetical protein
MIGVSDPAYLEKEKYSYNGHDYYILLAYDKTQRDEFIGGATYILFPEKNIIVATVLYNYNPKEGAKILSEEDVHTMTKELIDGVILDN